MNDRMSVKFKQIREALNLSQEEFGSKIGLKPVAVSSIERGITAVSIHISDLLCAFYHVNRKWLEKDIGDMFKYKNADIVEKVKKNFQISDMQEEVIKGFASLSSEERTEVLKILKMIGGSV